jgi:hypothetical protein
MNEEEALTIVCETLSKGFAKNPESGSKVNSAELEQSSENLLQLWRRETETASAPGKHGAFLGFHYVIPDQDLQLVECVTSVLTTAAGVGFLLPELGYEPHKGIAAAVTGVIVAFVKLFRNLGLSVHLDETDYAMVVLLHRSGSSGSSVQELKKQLKPSFPHISSDALSHRLNALTMCATVKGTKTALTWKDAKEQWHVNGV